jgi:putative redox protein
MVGCLGVRANEKLGSDPPGVGPGNIRAPTAAPSHPFDRALKSITAHPREGTMKGIGTWKGGYRTQLHDGRGHEVAVDLTPEEGGSDSGTSALELSVLSLAGCITTIFALVAKRRRLGFEAMNVELDADRPSGARTIASVDGILRVVTSAPVEDVATALSLTLRTCPVGVLYEQAHIPVRVRPIVVAPPASTGVHPP